MKIFQYLLFVIASFAVTFTNAQNSDICTGSFGDPIINITFGSGDNPGKSLTTIVPEASTTYNFTPVFGSPASPVPIDGSYTITNNIPDNPAWFHGATDHTGDPNGYMAFFNADPTPGEFYRQTVNICPGSAYEFSAWFANVLNSSVMFGVMPNIKFVIEKLDGTELGSYRDGGLSQSSSMTWRKMGVCFKAPINESSIVLKIINSNVGGNEMPGNDFAMDDITFRPAGLQTSASFDQNNVQEVLNICPNKPFSLFGEITSSDDAYDYLWQKSDDNGITWLDIANSNKVNLNLISPASGSGNTYLYRMLSSEVGNINSKGCRVYSNVTTLNVLKEACEVTSATVIPSFTAPDTVCVNTPVHINNTTIGANSYYWSFCTADLNQPPVGDNLGNLNGSFSLPVYSDIINVNGNYYVFVVNNYPGGLVRLDYGNSLLNVPITISLGNLGVIPNNAEGIQIVNANNRYYAIIVGGDPQSNVASVIVKIDFGNDITNQSPSAVNWGNLGDLDYPHDLYMFNENGTWYGFTTNYYNSTITKFDFGTNFNVPPKAVNIGNTGNLDHPVGIYALNDNGEYHVFITNSSSNTLTRLDFGKSLLNAPTGINLGNPNGTMHSCWDIYIIKYCNEIKGFVVNGDDAFNDVVSLDFAGNNITQVPSAISLGNIGNLSFPHSLSKLFRTGADVYSFIPNAHNNTLTRLKFPGCTAASIANSSAQIPPVFSYSIPGTYNITLEVDDGLTTQSSNCRQVFVAAPPDPHNIVDTGFCANQGLTLVSLTKNTNYLWNTGASTSSIEVAVEGKYWVTTDSYGCKSTDSFLVAKVPAPFVNLGNDTTLCVYDSITISAGNTGSSFLWQDGSTQDNLKIITAGVYSVAVTNFTGCTTKDTILIKEVNAPVISGLNDKIICKDEVAQLLVIADGVNNTYSWKPNATLSALDIANPIAKPDDTTQYYVAVKNQGGCTAKDSVEVKVLPRPIVSVRTDTTICNGAAVKLTGSSANASAFTWSPSIGLSNNNILSPDAKPLNTTTYNITASNGICNTSDNVTINVLPSPAITISNDTTICGNVAAQLNASGASDYSWFPANGLNDMNIQNPIATPIQTTLYHVHGIGDNGCISEDSVKVVVAVLPVFTINPTTAGVCLGDSVSVKASGGDIYKWDATPDINLQNMAETFIKPTTNTTYKVTVTNSVCKVSDVLTTTLFIAPKPVIHASSSNDIDCAANNTMLTANGGIRYSWFPVSALVNANSSSPVAMPDKTTVYHVVGTGVNGCKNEDSVTVKVNIANVDNGYQTASAFTPNNDGINDCFGVKKWSIVTSLNFSVYDRWGMLLFHSSNASDCWDGNYKGIQQPVGTYIYQIKAKTFCGDVYRKGTVVLIR